MPSSLARKNIYTIAPYEAGKPIAEVRREFGLTNIVKLASNENPLGPSPLAVRAIQKHASQVNLYPEGSCHDLRLALAKMYRLKPDHLFFGNGSNELLVLLGLAFLNQGDEVVFSGESFFVYQTVCDLMRAKAVVVPAVAHAHDLPAMAKAVTKKTKMVFLCNPNNPTGTGLKYREVAAFMQKMPTHCLVVFDTAYAEYVLDLDFGWGLPHLNGKTPVVILRTFSKFYGLAGLRIGYGIARPEITRAIERVRQPFNVDVLAQTAALAALSDTAFHRRVLQTNEDGKKYFYTELRRMGLEYTPTSANFVFIKLPIPGREAFQKLLRKGVIIRPMPGDFIRVTIGTARENIVFFRALAGVLSRA